MENKKLTRELIDVAESIVNKVTKSFFVIGVVAATENRDERLSFENSEIGYYYPGFCDRMESEPDTWVANPFYSGCKRFITYENAETFLKDKLAEGPYVIGKGHFLGEFCYHALNLKHVGEKSPDDFHGCGIFFIQEIKTTIPVITYPIEKIIAVTK